MQVISKINTIDWGLVDYLTAWQRQQQIFDSKVSRKLIHSRDAQNDSILTLDNDFILCQHPHVYTLGRNGNLHNLLISDQQLRAIGATFVKIDRGGDITYHGPGQIVGYPIFDLESLNLGLKAYINRLEQLIIDVIALYGIKGDRLEGATGVWLDPDTPNARKIAAIGVRASRFVTMHGFALNVNTDLKYFSYINPCGFVDKGVTSMAEELGTEIDINEVKQQIFQHAKHIFTL